MSEHRRHITSASDIYGGQCTEQRACRISSASGIKFKPAADEKGQSNGKQTRTKQSCKIKFKAKGAVLEISFFTTLEPALVGAWIPSFAMVLIQFAYMFIYK